MSGRGKKWSVVIREDRGGPNGDRVDNRSVRVEQGSPQARKKHSESSNYYVDGESFDAHMLGALEYLMDDKIHNLELDDLARAAFELGRRYEREHPREDFEPK